MKTPLGPYPAKRLGLVLSRQRVVVALPCLFLGILAGILAFPPAYSGSMRAGAILAGAGLFLAAAVLFCALLPRLTRPIFTTEEGVHYYARQNRWLEQRAWPWLALAVEAAGLALALYQGFYRPFYRLDYFSSFLLSFASVGLPLCFLLYRWLRRQLVRRTRIFPVRDESQVEPYSRRRELRRATAFWILYWLVALGSYAGLSAAFANWRLYVFIPVIALVYFVVRLIVGNPFRPYATIRRQGLLLRILNVGAVLALVAGVQVVLSSGVSYSQRFLDSLDYSVFRRDDPCAVQYDWETGVYTLTASREEFKILQLTDIHIAESLTTQNTDRLALQTCYDLIAATQPDLVLVTGDVAYAIPAYTFSNNNLTALGTFMNFMNRVGIPWALTYGNHDNEPTSMYRDARPFDGLFRHYRFAGESAALYAEVRPDIYGRYNQYLRICNPDGTLNRVIFLIDSNDYLETPSGQEYDCVHADQVQWYSDTLDALCREEGRTVPSFVFMHIPLPAFREARDALAAGDPAAQYLFGQDGEDVSCPSRDCGFFDQMVEKGSTQAVFVGHDHLNNMAIRYRGVDLVYSKSIDFVAYPGIASKTAQRGGTLITLHPDGGYDLRQVDAP